MIPSLVKAIDDSSPTFFSKIRFLHRAEERISVGYAFTKEGVILSFAYCHPSDVFTKAWGRQIVTDPVQVFMDTGTVSETSMLLSYAQLADTRDPDFLDSLTGFPGSPRRLKFSKIRNTGKGFKLSPTRWHNRAILRDILYEVECNLKRSILLAMSKV